MIFQYVMSRCSVYLTCKIMHLRSTYLYVIGYNLNEYKCTLYKSNKYADFIEVYMIFSFFL